jgi:hypothetical protein
MKCTCTQCGQSQSLDRSPAGLNYCSNCGNLFLVFIEAKVPTWIWGVVVVLMLNWQIMRTV